MVSIVLDTVLVALNSFNAYALISMSRRSTSRKSEADYATNKLTSLSNLLAYSFAAGASAALHSAVGVVSMVTGQPLTIYKWTHFRLAIVLVAAGLCIAIETFRLGRSFYIGFGEHNTLYFEVLYCGSLSQLIYGAAGVVLVSIAFVKSAFS
ncbi:hypothetical protein NQ176_g1698 [Zarea fungicola]|uniref:Uncharacterized protein n=1 Tax=Zarea fungicola TaxID=93591 RepID=A0ACC1NS95_9HYPO|nr:hypothetical protein NQ176_g1698 [Lecanicillium fungicola]